MKAPNFFIVGAPKCGTTALSEYLKTHPNIFISEPKEPHFFATDIKAYSGFETLDEYLKIFKNANSDQSAIGEASVLYLYSDFALQNLHDFNTDAKIIIMLRNHVDYIYSYHSQLVLNTDENVEDFETAWSLQEERKLGNSIPATCRVPKLLAYQEVGELGRQVERALKIFPRGQIHFILLDDLKKDTKQVYREVLEFLGIPDDGRIDFPVINDNKVYKNRFLGVLRNNPPKQLMAISKRIKNFLGLKNFHLMKKIHEMNYEKKERSPLNTEFRQKLVQVFSDDIDHLSQLIGRNLDHWKK